jgi:hypothetical protein
MTTRSNAAATTTNLTAAGPVCLLADEARPGVLTVVLEPGVAIEVLELQRLGDKCVVQLRYRVAPAADATRATAPASAVPLAA